MIFFVLYFARYIFADTIPYDPNSIVAFSDRAMYDLGLLGIFFILLFLEVLVFIYKLIRKKAILPKFTSRYLLILLVSFSLFWLYLYLFFSLYFFEGFVYVAYVLFPLFVIIGSIVVYPIAYYMRVRYIANAKAKISRYKNMKKVCITGSYGKSSVKEFLFSMLAVKSSVFKTPENKNSEM